jgi:hypothetical protein
VARPIQFAGNERQAHAHNITADYDGDEH